MNESNVHHLPVEIGRPAVRAQAARTPDTPVLSQEKGSEESAPPRLPSLIETANTAVSIARSAMSGEFPEDVHRAARKVNDDLSLIAVREHDRNLWIAVSILTSNTLQMAEQDSARRECWSIALSGNLALVRALLRITSEKMGLR